MIPIAKPLLGAEEQAAVLHVLNSGMLAQGQKVAEFEQAFAQFIGVRHAIATSNGTTALHAAVLAHGIGPGDEVITTPFTFIATANAIKMAGATPVFVDIDEDTFNLNASLIEAAITSKTKAILPVHLFGLPAEMDKLQSIARKHNIVIIEDAAQAHGAEFQGKKVGSFATGCFSFYPTKNMTTGEGGMITTNDNQLAERLRKIINHGSTQKYVHDSVGYNYRMTDIAAAIGIEQLKKLESFNQKRRANVRYLHQKLASIPGIIFPSLTEGHVFHQYTIRVTPKFRVSRDIFLKSLVEKGIGCSIFYPIPIHKQKAYVPYGSSTYPVAERMAQEVLSLPIHPTVSETDLDTIAAAIRGLA
ncbi:DegT/DnrJ/EryC1/StrS family aminotransferase [Candidatus Woesearchaeota archaeon]|nr:DegT/DnrJ/EryC1/StrS family aminotransferase [Candidatus Woesearchaeota archaeon]